MGLDFETTVTVGTLVSGITFAIGTIAWITRLVTRIEDNEKRNNELMDAFELQKQAYGILNEALQATRMDMMKSYATMEHMKALEQKMDEVAKVVIQVDKKQASQEATLNAIHETVTELRNRA